MAITERKRSQAFIEKEFKRLQARGNDHFSVGLIDDNIYTWSVLILGPEGTDFENGILSAKMVFPLNYPDAPPTFKFLNEMWHPNIDKDGNVCISILHKPGEDEFGYEELSERWMPVRNPESVILSIISLLSSPNIESPANLDAAQNYRDSPETYHKKIRQLVAKTLQ
ncbi:putative ubiquitin-conjugating enzyme E2 7 [Astathelohania contejeani]|uniref:Ubiquitin-conjugating enzyme E2 7 n=1 Tax=Astathelohania contejeani TaxID=164912 RepID=A0ABQ7HVM8_9MICR|nr:putative ubiquitin-conjugating enzyme E2 7 [Thelohania contejeani]